jgi:hypothetical protein
MSSWVPPLAAAERDPVVGKADIHHTSSGLCFPVAYAQPYQQEKGQAMTDQAHFKNSRPTQAELINRPATTPAYYHGIPATVWLRIFRNPKSRRKWPAALAEDRQP